MTDAFYFCCCYLYYLLLFVIITGILSSQIKSSTKTLFSLLSNNHSTKG